MTDIAGLIMYDVLDCMSDVLNIILGGGLYTFVVLTSLKHHESHHDCSVACYVSTIQKDAEISHCHLSDHQNR